MRKTRAIALLTAALTLALATHMQADEVDEAYNNFLAGQYDVVVRILFPYRVSHEGTLRVDFMLAVSACRLSDKDFKALGGFLLAAIPNWYEPLPANHLADIRTQAMACRSTGIDEQAAFERTRSKVEGKSDLRNAQGFEARRSSSGKDKPLPLAPVPSRTPGPVIVSPPPPAMGRLVDGLAYLQADYRSVIVESAAACSALCAREPKCAAMTFVVGQKRCWLKDRVPATANAAGYISAVKVQ